MKEFIQKNSIAYWVVIAILLVLAFIGTDGFQWYQWLAIAVAVVMAGYYIGRKIDG